VQTFVTTPAELDISPIFNILDLKKYYEGGGGDKFMELKWSILEISLVIKEIEEILDNCVGKSIRNRTYASLSQLYF